jgi:putative ABC transport system ATP-binding protein
MTHAADPIVRIDAIAKSYGTNGSVTWAVRGVSLEASAGELILLMGPSGSGKTTLLTMIAGLVAPTSGTVALYGRSLSAFGERERQEFRAKHIGFVFQNFLLVDSLDVLENVALVKRFAGTPPRRARAEAAALLERFGIGHLGRRLPPRLSQGEKQRAAIARAVANGAHLILADEPTASLESEQGFSIITMLRRLAHDERRCVLVATHDTRMTATADGVVRIVDGRADDRPPHYTCSTFTAVP